MSFYIYFNNFIFYSNHSKYNMPDRSEISQFIKEQAPQTWCQKQAFISFLPTLVSTFISFTSVPFPIPQFSLAARCVISFSFLFLGEGGGGRGEDRMPKMCTKWDLFLAFGVLLGWWWDKVPLSISCLSLLSPELSKWELSCPALFPWSPFILSTITSPSHDYNRQSSLMSPSCALIIFHNTSRAIFQSRNHGTGKAV